MQMKNPAHPGEILAMMYLEPLGLTVTDAAAVLNMPHAALSEIVNGKRAVTPQTALKLQKAFNQPAAFWLSVQSAWELAHADSHCADSLEDTFT
jgi:addiction module antidote protein HigA